MLDLTSMLLSQNGQSASNPELGKNNQLGRLDSAFEALLSDGLDLSSDAALQQGADQAFKGQFAIHDTLESHLQNSQTLLFANSAEQQAPSVHFQLNDLAEFADATMSTQAAQLIGVGHDSGSTATSVTQLKVAVKWGMLATGHLAQQLVSTVDYGLNEGLTDKKSTLNQVAAQLTNVHTGASTVTAHFKVANQLQNNFAANNAPSLRTHSVNAEKALLETAKPYFDPRYQPYSTQALFVFTNADKSVKVSARDYFGGQEQADAVGGWLDEFVDQSVLKNIKEYSFNGKVIFKRDV